MAPKAIRPDHVAIYVRWSTDDQSHGTTLEEQMEGCRFYILSQGWHVRDDLVYLDDGWSGGTLDRPAMHKLRDLVQAGEVDCVVVLKLDRLSRNIVDAVELVLREWDELCYIKSVREPIDTTSDIGRVIFTMLSSFADFERYQIRERTQSGKERRIRNGEQMHGEAAFGYRRHPDQKGVWIENQDESPLLRQMFGWCDQGMAANSIMVQLNQSGYRTRRGNEWSVRAVLHILRNRTYIGEAQYGASTLKPVKNSQPHLHRLKTLASRRPKRQKRIRIINAVPKFKGRTSAAPALIDEALFERVQQRLTSNRTRKDAMGGRGMSSPNLLSGLLQCECGASMQYKTNKVRGKEYRYYRCLRGIQGTCHANGHIPADIIEEMIEAQFLNLYGQDESRHHRMEPHILALDEKYRSLQLELQRARAEMQQFSDEDADLIRQVRRKEITMAQRSELRQYIEADVARTRDRIQSLELSLHEAQASSQSLRTTVHAMATVEMWASVDTQQKRSLLEMVLRDRITVLKPKGEDKVQVKAPWAF